MFGWTCTATPPIGDETPAAAEGAAPAPSLPVEDATWDDRRVTRTQSTANPHLQPPALHPRRESAQSRVARAIRSRSPSPRPAEDDVFNFPTVMAMNAEEIKALVVAAMEMTSQNQRTNTESLRRPDLPPFDQNNIDTWIRRVNAAFTRSHITDARTKFAYMDKIFQANSDPVINSLLCGPQTAEKWDELIEHLRELHGRTTTMKAYSIINGVPREGRRPSQLAALMEEQAGDVTLDDVLKENLLKELPVKVRDLIASEIDGLTFKETARLADKHFDKDGKLKNAGPSASSVSSVQQQKPSKPSETVSFTEAFPSQSEADVNAVRFRQGEKQNFNISNRSSTASASRGRGGFRGGFGSHSNSSQNYSSSSAGGSGQAPAKNRICHFHTKFGEKAERCEHWCMLNSKYPAQQTTSGKAKAGQ